MFLVSTTSPQQTTTHHSSTPNEEVKSLSPSISTKSTPSISSTETALVSDSNIHQKPTEQPVNKELVKQGNTFI